MGDQMGVHLREGSKGLCVPGSEGKHMVSVSLGVSDTEDKRRKRSSVGHCILSPSTLCEVFLALCL